MEISFRAENLATKYKIVFGEQARKNGFSDTEFADIVVDETNICSVKVPEGVEYGNYEASVIVCDRFGAQSRPADFSFVIGYPRKVVKTKHQDIIYVSNPDNKFVAYQWLKDDVDIPGATKQFYTAYNDTPEHQIYGTFAVLLTLTTGETYKTCPIVIEKPVSKTVALPSVVVYPNPVKAGVSFTIELKNITDDELSETVIYIYNSLGLLMEKIENPGISNQTSLPAGIYTGRGVSGDRSMSFKVIVE